MTEVVDGAKVLKTFLSRCNFCLNITRCFMKFAAKWTTPVVWAEIQFKFWHWMFTYWATTLYLGPLFTPKHDRSISFMIRNRLTCWKLDLVELGFPPFLAPLLLIFLREMGQNGVSDQLLGRFTPSLLHLCLFMLRTPSIKKWCRLGQWVVRYGGLVAKNRVHAAGN